MRIFVGIVITLLVAIVILGGMIAFGTGKAPPPAQALNDPFRSVDFSRMPAAQTVTARDGGKLAYRLYPALSTASPERVVILVHGATASSPSMHALASALAAQNMIAYSLDLRGHGDSGRRGDIDYPGQLDDDLADIVRFVMAQHPSTPIVLTGFSAGGGFSLHTAATPLGSSFERIVLVSPMFGYHAPTTKMAGGNSLVTPFVPRIVAITILNRAGVHVFDHLQTLAFGDFGRPELTTSYSFGMMQAFGTLDYAADVRNAHAPLAVVVGAEDQFFMAEKFAPTLNEIRPGISVTIMPRLDHIQMLTDPSAVPAIVAAIRGRQT